MDNTYNKKNNDWIIVKYTPSSLRATQLRAHKPTAGLTSTDRSQTSSSQLMREEGMVETWQRRRQREAHVYFLPERYFQNESSVVRGNALYYKNGHEPRCVQGETTQDGTGQAPSMEFPPREV